MNRLRRCLCFSLLFIWSFYQIWRSLQLIRHSPEVEKVTMVHLLQRNAMSQEKNGMIRYEQNRTEIAESRKTTLSSFHYKSCSLSDTMDTSNIKTPFKIYIYDLPSAFNLDITQRLMKKDECYSLEYCGIGERLFDIGNDMFVHDTHQFSLEVVLHHKLLFSPYRTLDPDKADIFYIPAYIGLHCMEFSHTVGKLVDTLFQYLNGSEYFRMGKPHFSTVAKIEREMTTTNCPYFRRSETSKITYFGIEKENAFISRYGHAISVPYPSYVHSSHEGRTLDIPDLDKRDVYVLLCAGQRRSNKYRAKIMDQIPNKTSLSYDKYVSSHTIPGQDIIMLFTNECSPGPAKNTIPWMRHSVFCLQPPGDSPTRKSLYDAILSGCIPVLFPYPKQSSVWAFNNVFNYSEFTVTIPYDAVTSRGQKVLDILKVIPREGIQKMHNKVKEVSQWFQYTSIDGNINSHTDAVQIILKELENIYKFQKTS